jgi:predicted AAA+ superfamily ATPase
MFARWKSVYSRDTFRDPVTVFGRRDILDWVEVELSNIYTNALVLYGQRRVGKTTILLQLRHSLSSKKFLPIYFDLQDQAKKRLGEVLANLVKNIKFIQKKNWSDFLF